MAGSSSDLTVVSLFSGAGGLDLAACQTGRVGRLFSTDSNSTFLQTVIDNIPTHFPDVEHSHLSANVCDLTGEMIKSALGVADVDLVIGGPPCDDFTSTGRKRGLRGDKAPLVFEYARLVGEIGPQAFLFENVPNLKMMCGDVFEELKKRLTEHGYALEESVLAASAYGVPSIRKRLFVVGMKKEGNHHPFSFPMPTHGEMSTELPVCDAKIDSASFVKVRDVLSDLPDVNDTRARDYLNHTGRSHRPQTVAHLKTVPQGMAVRKSYRYRAPWGGLCRSLTAGVDHSTKSYIHPIFHREMSVREYARIHGFPDTWWFSGNHHNGIKQVANAVPVPLGMTVVARLLETIGGPVS